MTWQRKRNLLKTLKGPEMKHETNFCNCFSLPFIPYLSFNCEIFDAKIYRRISIKNRLIVSSNDFIGQRAARCWNCWCISRNRQRIPNWTNSMGRFMFNRLQYYGPWKFQICNTRARQFKIITKWTVRIFDWQQSRFRPFKRGKSLNFSLNLFAFEFERWINRDCVAQIEWNPFCRCLAIVESKIVGLCLFCRCWW